MSTYHCFGCGGTGAMKLSTNTLRVFIYLRGVSLMSFAIVVYPKMLMLRNVIFVLTICTS